MADAVEALLADPRSALVALDFDGTLAAIVERPEDSRLVPGAHEVLQLLAAAVGTLAIVTGRAADEAVRLGELDGVPGVRVLGHYGLQTWYGGELTGPPPDAAVERARAKVAALLAAGAPEGVYIEDKEHSFVVQTRPAASPQQALDDLTPALQAVAAAAGLEAVPGKLVLELRPSGTDKGTVLRQLQAETGATTVIYVGDDVGDVPAFEALEAMRVAGEIAGLAVIAMPPSGGDEAPPRLLELADLVLPGPEAVVAWLAGLVALLT